MKRFIAPVVASLAIAGAANASFTYQLDDGTSENSIGLTDGGTFNWGNMFEVDAMGGPIVESIEFGFGAGVAGLTGTWFVYTDDDADPTTGLIELASGSHTVVNDDFTANGVTDLISVGSLDVSSANNLFVAFEITHEAGTFPAAIDEGPSAASSWLTVGDASAWPNGGIIDDFGLPGNWIIRANAIPGPGVLAVFGLAGLAGTRRRRG